MQPRPTLAFGDDGSPAADVCWRWINSHTWPGWQLEIITAQEAPIGPPPTPEDATLHRWDPPTPRTPFAETTFDDVEHLTAQIDPRLALSRPADLVVIGPRGPGLLKALHLGSTAEWLLQHPIAPLVIARSGHPVRTVIAGHDGSPHARRAVRCLTKLPWIGSVDVTILVVKDGRADVEDAAAMARSEFGAVDLRPEILDLDGKPTAAILEVIGQRAPDLVALRHTRPDRHPAAPPRLQRRRNRPRRAVLSAPDLCRNPSTVVASRPLTRSGEGAQREGGDDSEGAANRWRLSR